MAFAITGTCATAAVCQPRHDPNTTAHRLLPPAPGSTPGSNPLIKLLHLTQPSPAWLLPHSQPLRCQPTLAHYTAPTCRSMMSMGSGVLWNSSTTDSLTGPMFMGCTAYSVSHPGLVCPNT